MVNAAKAGAEKVTVTGMEMGTATGIMAVTKNVQIKYNLRC